MDFFKSIFADDPYPPDPESESNSLKDQDSTPDSPPKQSDSNPTGWSFGDLVKTIASRSESVIEVYRRDLQEFGTGLKNEIEVAHGSLGNVGHAIDELGSTVLKGTVQIINQGRDVILAASNESDSPSSESNSRSFSTQRGLNSRGYSRFDAQLRAIQGDISTYGEEPEDFEDYKKWKSGFNLEDKKEDVERLMEENGEIESIYKRVGGVSDGIDQETCWCRYFYRVYKLQLAEDMRLSWDVDDDDDKEVDVKNVGSNPILKKDDEIVEEKAVNLESNGDFPANKEQVEKVEKDKEKNPVEELRVESDDAEKKGHADENQVWQCGDRES
ncbi:BSD domain-containing protein 1 [Gossypium hirsutum]|uniref:BSD domain-containing protein 1 n=1 Tax=Gossypium hirsutum TaxID=3635 RepID=A0A1U8PYM5_GOSHI|nr:BSD domain-containing protein 1-like [Gossypium hirsutum]